MKKRIISLVLAIIMCASLVYLPAFADGEAEPGSFTYEEVIAPMYEEASGFSEGLAAVKKDGKWGFINTDNETVIPFEYDIAYSFSEGYAVVGTSYGERDYGDGIVYPCYKMGFIDKENNYVGFIDPYYYDEANNEYDEGPLVRIFWDDPGSYDYCFHNGYICLSSGSAPEYFLYDTKGDMQFFGEEYISYYGWQITEGIIITGYAASETGEQRYFNTLTGKYLDIDHEEYEQWVNLRPFNNGLAFAKLSNWDYDDYSSSGLWGVIDTKGNWVIDPAYADFMVQDTYGDYIVFGETGLAMVKRPDGIWGGIDKTGATVIPFEYEALRPYHYGLAAFAKDGLYGYLNDKGEVAIPAQYVITSGFNSFGIAAAYDGEKAFIIDTKGNVIPGSDVLDPDNYFVYQEDTVPTTYTPGEYVVIEKNGLYGFGHIEYVPALPDKSEMHAWAYEEVVAAIKENLVPVSLRNLYLHNISREDFCTLAVCAVEEVLEKDIDEVVLEYTGKPLAEWVAAYPFHDTSNSDIIAANALGIINGRGNGVFDPYSSITRQEAAAMLMRTASTLGMDTTEAADSAFKDAASIAPWAQDAVDYVFSIGVMNGTGNDSFSPRNTYTREQSYMTIYRLFVAVLEDAVN